MRRIVILLLVLLFGFGLGYGSHDIVAEEKSRSPELALEHYYQGVFYGKQAKYVEAITELERAIELNPAYADAYNALAVIYHRQKHYQDAIEHYLLAIEADPNHAKARTNLAMLYVDQQAYAKALRQLEKTLEIDPEYAPAKELIDEVRAKVEAEEAKERERQQREAQRTPTAQPERPPQPEPEAAKALFRSGTTLIKQGQIDAGIREYQKGLDIAPSSAEGYTLLGMAYREKYRTTRQGKWRQEALTMLTLALKDDPKHVPALLGLGEMLYEQGDVAKAIPYFQKVLRYQPNHPAKAQIEALLGQPR